MTDDPRALGQHVSARASLLAGSQPDWLDQLIGPRPADPIGETTWDTLTADIARWRSRHQIDGPGLGPVPEPVEQRQQWHDLHRRLTSTRRWLVGADRHEPSWPAVRSRAELLERRTVLDRILDSAPDDTRPIINAVRAGQLTLTDVDEIVRAAGDGRDARKHWILEHWPHVVEYAEVTSALTERRWGPDPDLLFGDVDEGDVGVALAAAIQRRAPWLRAALCAIDAVDDTPLNDQQLAWLDAVADHRLANDITTRDPLGPIPIDPEALVAFDALLTDLRDARAVPQPERHDLGIEF